eukprot:6986862-Karenia_brevis.AAC.1
MSQGLENTYYGMLDFNSLDKALNMKDFNPQNQADLTASAPLDFNSQEPADRPSRRHIWFGADCNSQELAE